MVLNCEGQRVPVHSHSTECESRSRNSRSRSRTRSHCGNEPSIGPIFTRSPLHNRHRSPVVPRPLCIDCNRDPSMRCLLCLGCYDQRRRCLVDDDFDVKGFVISGSEIRPTGLTRLAPSKTIDHYLSMPDWQIKRGDQWVAMEGQPRVVLYEGEKDGRLISLRAGPYDDIGLFGSKVTFLLTEASPPPLTPSTLISLEGVSTPPSPPMRD